MDHTDKEVVLLAGSSIITLFEVKQLENISYLEFHLIITPHYLILKYLGVVIFASLFIIWCYGRFAAKKRFDDDQKYKNSKGKVNLQVNTLIH